ncbi:MAG: PAC2 family protein, partial [Chloroflexi bacterium]|nr:PAC2 family protein [Chloroflexota bacterium]
LDRMTAAGIPCASYWGHSPHYVQAKPNPNVTKALLEAVTEIIPVEVDTERLQRRGGDFTRRLTKALADQDEVTKYVSELEERWDKANSPSDDESSGEAAAPLIAELEAFLRSEAGSQSDEMSDDESDDQDQDEGNPPSV